jgi:hypothetical protein
MKWSYAGPARDLRPGAESLGLQWLARRDGVSVVRAGDPEKAREHRLSGLPPRPPRPGASAASIGMDKPGRQLQAGPVRC